MQPKSLKSTGPTSAAGMMFARFRQSRKLTGPAMLFAADSPARTSAEAEIKQSDLVLPGSGGKNLPGSFAFYDQRLQLWKTYQTFFSGESEPFLETWPRQGMTRNGAAFRLASLVAPKDGIGSFLLPTLGACEHKGSSRARFLGSGSFRGAKMSEALRKCYSDPAYLNPSFAEMAMGFPAGWTALDALETPLCHKSQNGSADE